MQLEQYVDDYYKCSILPNKNLWQFYLEKLCSLLPKHLLLLEDSTIDYQVLSELEETGLKSIVIALGVDEQGLLVYLERIGRSDLTIIHFDFSSNNWITTSYVNTLPLTLKNKTVFLGLFLPLFPEVVLLFTNIKRLHNVRNTLETTNRLTFKYSKQDNTWRYGRISLYYLSNEQYKSKDSQFYKNMYSIWSWCFLDDTSLYNKCILAVMKIEFEKKQKSEKGSIPQIRSIKETSRSFVNLQNILHRDKSTYLEWSKLYLTSLFVSLFFPK